MEDEESVFDVWLEVKENSVPFFLFGSYWARKHYRLVGTLLSYKYNGSLEAVCFISGSLCEKVPRENANDKPYPFHLTSKTGTRLLFNAPTEDIREQCVIIFNYASRDHKWINPFNSVVVPAIDSLKPVVTTSPIVATSTPLQTPEHDKRQLIAQKINEYNLLSSKLAEVKASTKPGDIKQEPSLRFTISVVNPETILTSEDAEMDEITQLERTYSTFNSRTSNVRNTELSFEDSAAMAEVVRHRQALSKLQKMWRSRSSRDRTMKVLTASGELTHEQLEIIASKIQSKFRVHKAGRVMHELYQKSCPQILKVSVNSVVIDDKTTSRKQGKLATYVCGTAESKFVHSDRSEVVEVSQCGVAVSGLSQVQSQVSQQSSSLHSNVALATHTKHMSGLVMKVCKSDLFYGERVRGLAEIQIPSSYQQTTEKTHMFTVPIQSVSANTYTLYKKNSKEKFPDGIGGIAQQGALNPNSLKSASIDNSCVSTARGSGIGSSGYTTKETTSEKTLRSLSSFNTATDRGVTPDSMIHSAPQQQPLPQFQWRRGSNLSNDSDDTSSVMSSIRPGAPSPTTAPSVTDTAIAEGMTIGSVTVAVTPVNMTYAMCGWINKHHTSQVSDDHTARAATVNKQQQPLTRKKSFLSVIPLPHSNNNSAKSEDDKLYKKRWFVLLDGTLQCFSGSYSLDKPKQTIDCRDVTAITQEKYKGTRAIRITYKVRDSDACESDDQLTTVQQGPYVFQNNAAPKLLGGRRKSFLQSPIPVVSSWGSSNNSNNHNNNNNKFKLQNTQTEQWLLHWDREESAFVVNMWVRKLYRACPLLVDPTLDEASCLTNIVKSSSRGLQ